LLEAGWGDMMDVVLYVDADRARREERVKSRGWTSTELARREAAQWPAEKKKAGADEILNNDVWETCRREVDALFQRWTAVEPAAAEARPMLVSVNEKDA
jgi:dephospho-CoA kinase